MKIYTRTGDSGETGLYGGDRIAKDAPRIEAYGTIDELNAALGAARAAQADGELDLVLARVQEELFVLGAELAVPPGGKASASVGTIGASETAALESEIDRWEAELEPLKSFILPGGTAAAAALHVARGVCRRAERRVLALGRSEVVPPAAVVYLNRLSDHLFVAARLANLRQEHADVPWRPRVAR